MNWNGSKVRGSLAAGAAIALVGAALVLSSSTTAQGFGTVNGLGQNGEHERITRVLGKAATDGLEKRDFQPRTLDELAGKDRELGAVGAPDNPVDSSNVPLKGLGPGYKHCDDGDYLDRPGYPHSRASADKQIKKCVEYYESLLRRSVNQAGELVGTDKRLNPRETNINNCKYGFEPDLKQPAKCEVLNGLGRALHLAEDFWSHSNWGDEAAAGPISVTNPPGLNRDEIPAFFEYPTPAKYSIPDRLLTGCDDSLPLHECKNRVTHSNVAKDNGKINPNNGTATPTDKYPRSLVGDNFQAAVRGARKQAKFTWREVQRAIGDKYGDARGDEIVRAITHDAPWTDCSLVNGKARMATHPPVGNTSSNRSVAVTLRNQTSARLFCTKATLDSGEWSNAPESPVAAGGRSDWRAQSNGAGVEGSAEFRIGDNGPRDELEISWDNPLFGSNGYTCRVPDAFRCQRSEGSGNQAKPTFTISRR